MKIIEVSSRKTRSDFLKLPKILYKKDLYWVCPLDAEIESIFDPQRNKFFSTGNANRWILKDEKDRLIGRIAAFHYSNYANANNQPTGGIGFFECINDQGAANILFDTAREWLAGEGMQAMDGPINFGENDNHWGLLVAGFIQPAYGMPYNFSYYRELFESYGFRLYYEQYSYHLDITVDFPERFWKIADWVLRKPGFCFEHARLSEAERFMNDLVNIYNTAWIAFKKDFTPLDPEVLRRSFIKAKPIIDEELVWFIYHNNEPVSFFLILPDINMILKHLNGKLNLPGIVKYLYYKKTHTIKRVRAVSAGVVPKFQGTGLESAIFRKLEDVFRKRPWITEIELSWVADYNPKMRSTYEAVGAKLAKKHITYRYLFDLNAPFERYMPEVIDHLMKDKTKTFQTEIHPDSGALKKKYNYLFKKG